MWGVFAVLEGCVAIVILLLCARISFRARRREKREAMAKAKAANRGVVYSDDSSIDIARFRKKRL
jgi:hypothetical protein